MPDFKTRAESSPFANNTVTHLNKNKYQFYFIFNLYHYNIFKGWTRIVSSITFNVVEFIALSCFCIYLYKH